MHQLFNKIIRLYCTERADGAKYATGVSQYQTDNHESRCAVTLDPSSTFSVAGDVHVFEPDTILHYAVLHPTSITGIDAVLLHLAPDNVLYGISSWKAMGSVGFLEYITKAVMILLPPHGVEIPNMKVGLAPNDYHNLHCYNRQSLSRDAIMSLLSLANRKGAVTAGELHSHFASQNPDRAGATSSLSYTVYGPFSQGGFDVNAPPPRFNISGRSYGRPCSPNYLDRQALNIALYVFAHERRGKCYLIVDHLIDVYSRYFNEEIPWSAHTIWGITRAFGFGQLPESKLEVSLLTFYKRFRVIPCLEDIATSLEYHQLSHSLCNPYAAGDTPLYVDLGEHTESSTDGQAMDWNSLMSLPVCDEERAFVFGSTFGSHSLQPFSSGLEEVDMSLSSAGSDLSLRSSPRSSMDEDVDGLDGSSVGGSDDSEHELLGEHSDDGSHTPSGDEESDIDWNYVDVDTASNDTAEEDCVMADLALTESTRGGDPHSPVPSLDVHSEQPPYENLVSSGSPLSPSEDKENVFAYQQAMPPQPASPEYGPATTQPRHPLSVLTNSKAVSLSPSGLQHFPTISESPLLSDNRSSETNIQEEVPILSPSPAPALISTSKHAISPTLISNSVSLAPSGQLFVPRVVISETARELDELNTSLMLLDLNADALLEHVDRNLAADLFARIQGAIQSGASVDYDDAHFPVERKLLLVGLDFARLCDRESALDVRLLVEKRRHAEVRRRILKLKEKLPSDFLKPVDMLECCVEVVGVLPSTPPHSQPSVQVTTEPPSPQPRRLLAQSCFPHPMTEQQQRVTDVFVDTMEGFFADMVASYPSWEKSSPSFHTLLYSNIMKIPRYSFDYAISLAIQLYTSGIDTAYFAACMPDDARLRQAAGDRCVNDYFLSLPRFTTALLRIVQALYVNTAPAFLVPLLVDRGRASEGLYALMEFAASLAEHGRWDVVGGQRWMGFGDGIAYRWLPALIDRSDPQTSLVTSQIETPLLAQVVTHSNLVVNRAFNLFNMLRQSFYPVDSITVCRDLTFPDLDSTFLPLSLVNEILSHVINYLGSLLRHQLSIHGQTIVVLGEYEDASDARITVLEPLPLRLNGLSGFFNISERKRELEEILALCVRLMPPHVPHPDLQLFTEVDVFSSGGIPYNEWLPIIVLCRGSVI